MIRETVTPLVMATLVVLAGCAGAISSAPSGSADATKTGTVNFYISDERNAIDEFEHLNVTITAVGFKKADADDEGDDENESDEPETTNTTTSTTTTTTTTTTTNTTTTTESEEAEEQDESEVEDKNESDDWVVRQVDNVTVDLTEYQGANATLLEQFEIPNGTYTKTFVYISDVNGTLKSGEQVNVKLPSQKLHINSAFTVGNGESIDFVFDITVIKAGQGGKYILKPVVGQSGTDVPIEAEQEEAEGEDEQGPPEDVDTAGNDSDAADLSASFLGNVTRGENVTISVTQNGSAVEGAQVFVGDKRVGETAADGTITVHVPSDAEEFEVNIRYQGSEAELEVEFETEETTTTTTATTTS